jgi:LysM repeat protein
MTAAGQPTLETPSDGDSDARQQGRRDGAAVGEVCPFLAGVEAPWRSAYADRDQRCGAVRPAALLAVQKQRQLCLVADHRGCATYVAARDVATESAGQYPGDDGAALWLPSTSGPLVLEPPRRRPTVPASATRGGQALLVALMVVALVVLVVARTQSPAGSAGPTPGAGGQALAGSPSGTAQATAEPTLAPATPVPSATAEASPDATPTGTPDATAASARTYKVRSGDTLSSIASRFGTTVKRLKVLNSISDPRSLRIGQVLQLP